MENCIKVKANRYTYEVLEFTTDKDVINEFVGYDCIVSTHVESIGFNSEYYHEITYKTTDDKWVKAAFLPELILLKRSDGQITLILDSVFNVIFNR